MLLRELLDDLYAPLQGVSDRTQKLYGMTIKAYGEFLGCEPTIEHLAEVPVARFLQQRLSDRAAATAAKDRAQLRALWEFAARRGIVSDFPTLRTIRVPERVPEAWTIGQMQQLLQSASEASGYVSGVPACDFWPALLLVCFETGERISAVLGLRWDDVTDDAVIFRAETRKRCTRDIYRGITPTCREHLEAIRRPRGLVFAWDRNATDIFRHLGIITKRAGLPCDRRSKFHRIRRTTASYAAAAGVDAQKLLDHSSPTTTRRYLDPRIVKPPQACDVLPTLKLERPAAQK